MPSIGNLPPLPSVRAGVPDCIRLSGRTLRLYDILSPSRKMLLEDNYYVIFQRSKLYSLGYPQLPLGTIEWQSVGDNWRRLSKIKPSGLASAKESCLITWGFTQKNLQLFMSKTFVMANILQKNDVMKKIRRTRKNLGIYYLIVLKLFCMEHFTMLIRL